MATSKFTNLSEARDHVQRTLREAFPMQPGREDDLRQVANLVMVAARRGRDDLAQEAADSLQLLLDAEQASRNEPLYFQGVVALGVRLLVRGVAAGLIGGRG